MSKIKDFFTSATSKKVATAAVNGAELGSNALKAKGEIIGSVSDGGGAILSGTGAVVGAVTTVSASIEAGSEVAKLTSAQMQKVKLRDAKRDPEVKDLLQEREHCSTVLIMQNNEISKVERKIAENNVLKGQILSEMNDPDSPALSPEEVEMAEQQIAGLERNNEFLQGRIDAYKEAGQALDDRITEINQNPKIANLRVLEAKVDLATEVLKDKKSSVRALLGAGEKVVGTAADGAQLVMNVAQIVGVGGNAMGTALNIAGPGITIATSAVQGTVAAVNLGMDVQEINENSKMEKKAHAARNEAPIDNPQLEAAFKCIELNAKHTKYIKTVEAIRDGAAVGTAVASGAAGAALLATAVATAASAPGFGAGGVAPAVVAGGATAVGVGCAAVTATTAVGVWAAKKGIQRHNDAILNEAQLAMSGMDKLIKLAQQDPANPNVDLPPLTKEEQAAIKNIQEHSVKRNQGDGTKGLSAKDAGDLDKLRAYAECRAISRENKLAIDVLSKELMWECKDALLHRKGSPIVMADLPQNSPALNGLRKLGISDRELVGLVNAVAHLDTREIGHKNLQKKTGLAM